jgi:hypothetical protein
VGGVVLRSGKKQRLEAPQMKFSKTLIVWVTVLEGMRHFDVRDPAEINIVGDMEESLMGISFFLCHHI